MVSDIQNIQNPTWLLLPPKKCKHILLPYCSADSLPYKMASVLKKRRFQRWNNYPNTPKKFQALLGCSFFSLTFYCYQITKYIWDSMLPIWRQWFLFSGESCRAELKRRVRMTWTDFKTCTTKNFQKIHEEFVSYSLMMQALKHVLPHVLPKIPKIRILVHQKKSYHHPMTKCGGIMPSKMIGFSIFSHYIILAFSKRNFPALQMIFRHI